MSKIVQVAVLAEELSNHQENIWRLKEELRVLQSSLEFQEKQKEDKFLKLLDVMETK